MVKKFVEGIMNKAIKNVTLQHCIQYADDVKKGDTVTCRKLEFKNFHDYKNYRPSDCNNDMVNFFVKGVGSTNKGKSTSGIIQNMKDGNCNSPYVFNKRDSDKPIESSKEIFLKKQQKLVPRLINPQTNLKGLLVYHGLGSGKTGTSIIVGEACKHIMTAGDNISKGSDRSKGRVLVVVPASLKEQYKQEILGNLVHRKSTEDKDNIKKIIKENIKNINPYFLEECFQIQGGRNKIKSSFSNNVLINNDPQNYINVSKEVNFSKKQLDKQTSNISFQKVNKAYKVVSRQTFMKHFLISDEDYKPGEGVLINTTVTGYCINRFLTKPNGLLIIDEIQNLISETGSWYKNLIRGIKYYCHPTTKILLLTATPIYDKIFELGLTLNLLNPRIRFPETRNDFDKLFVATSENELKDEEGRKNSKDIKERKSVFSTKEERIKKYENIVQHKKLTDKQVKEEFEMLEGCYYELTDYLRKYIDKNEILPTNTFSPDLKNIIKSSGYNVNRIDFIALFDLAKQMKQQLGLNEYRNSVIKNKDLFEYMCSGYISYFKGGDPKGFPKKITKIIDCQMSNNQANAYIGVVKMEVKKNRDAEASRKINPNSIQQGTYFQKATMASNVHLIHKIQGNNEEKARQDLIKKILKLPKIKELEEIEPEIVGNINKMNITQLQFLFEKITEPVESIHHSQNEEEQEKEEKEEREKEFFSNLKKIVKKSSKRGLKQILEERKRMTKAYYEATLKVIMNELKNQKDDDSRLNFIKDKYSCKFAKMISKILNEEKNKGKHFIYSRFKTRGVECISYMLEGFGFKRYTEENIQELKKMMDKDIIPKEKCFTVWSGDITDKNEFSKVFKSIYNHPKNRRGDYLKIVIGTESIMEGVNLKEVKYVHITEPWWNESRMDQVMGRAIRWKSHINMPPKEREVIIYRYYAIAQLRASDFAPQLQPVADSNVQTLLVNNALDRANLTDFESNVVREGRNWKVHQLENPEPISPLAFSSIDRYIQGVAEKKKRLNQMFYQSIKNSAIDCLFNKFGNTYRLEEEFYYKADFDSTSYYYDPTEHKYYDKETNKELTKEIYGNVVEIKPKEKGKVIKIKDDKEIYYENIDCNSRTKTGKEFENFLKNNNFSHLLNTEHHNKIKEIIFNLYNEGTSDRLIEQIKQKFIKCLLGKISKQERTKLLKIFNAPITKSPKQKIITQIISIFREQRFNEIFEPKFKELMKKKEKALRESHRMLDGEKQLIEKKFKRKEEELRSYSNKEVEAEAQDFRLALNQQSLDYLKEQHGYLKIGNRADLVYKKTFKKINDKAMLIPESSKVKKRGRKRTTDFNPNVQPFIPNDQPYDPNDPMNWVGYNPAYDEKGPE